MDWLTPMTVIGAPKRILYGVQGTGNGHLSRARAMASALSHSDIRVDWLFSGRDPQQYFDMQCFGDCDYRRGLTFVTVDGQVHYLKTALRNHYLRFIRDVWSLELGSYDAVISDFEPISAWAGRLRSKPVISIGHQPAFDYDIPIAGRDLCSSLVMRLFAPGTIRVGMHWHPFGAPILPPLIDVKSEAVESRRKKVLVYLPFEPQSAVHSLLSAIPDFDFYIYAPGSERADNANLYLRPTSLNSFRRDLHDCSAVICNAGFELASECLALGKRLLVKPQGRQMEQISNALALSQLGYGAVVDDFDSEEIRRWLSNEQPAAKIDFPDVARALVCWLQGGEVCANSLKNLSDQLWRSVRIGREGTVSQGQTAPQ